MNARFSPLFWLIAFLFATPAAAHLTPNSEVELRIHADGVSADMIIPLGEYAFATGNLTDNSEEARFIAERYLQDRFKLISGSGTEWVADYEIVEFVQLQGPPDLHAIARFTPPKGESGRQFKIQWNAVVGQVPGHFALFILADDFGASVGDREILGIARSDQRMLPVDRDAVQGRAVFTNAAKLGAHHIVLGYDHVMFLLALLLPAGLVTSRGKWRASRNTRSTILHLLGIVTAFTAGHSLTLIASTSFGWKLPAAPVEIAIAISVLISAVHAIRPVFPGKEALVALVFGLIHGLAFATLVADAGVAAASRALGLIGFNLGIEIAQIAIVIVALPAIMLFASSKKFQIARNALAVFAILCSLIWIVDRAIGSDSRIVYAAELAAVYAAGALVLMSVFAIFKQLLPNALDNAAQHLRLSSEAEGAK